MSTYKIKLDHFEGPFDLLLFFIERDELDIFDIPISKLTADFLAYIKELESLNLDVASEFILVAASLMRIKAKMLIPRKELDEHGNEIDPREELVLKLLEYKRYKSIIVELQELEQDRSLKFERGNVTDELLKISNRALVDVELESLSLFNLLKTFERVLNRFEEREAKTVHQIYRYPYTIQEQQDFIFKKLKKDKKFNFEKLFVSLENRMHAIVTFLAILELLNVQKIQIIGGEKPNQFWINEV